MENITTAGSENITGFVSKVTRFDSDTKNDLLNIVQYVITAIIPITIVYFIIKRLFDSDKPPTGSTLELLAEITAQAITTVVLLLVVHRIIESLPTYSGVPIAAAEYPNIILGLTISMISFNPIVSSKINIIYTRLMDYWNGNSTVSVNDNSVSVSQPISGSRQLLPRHQNSRADDANLNHNPPPIVPNRQLPMPPPQQQQNYKY